MKTHFADADRRVPAAAGVSGRVLRDRGRRPRGPAVRSLVGALLCATVLAGRADLSAPDNVVYGIVVLGTNQMTADNPEIVVEARRTNGLLVARYRMGDQVRVGNHYLLTIKVEETAPRQQADAVMTGEMLSIRALSNNVVQAQQSFAVTERGRVERLDFGVVAPEVLGFELWALAWGVQPDSQHVDLDGDGISNLGEYQAGSNPTDADDAFLLRIAGSNHRSRISFDAIRAEGVAYEGVTRHYALERRSDLQTAGWQAVPGYTDIIGSNQEVVFESADAGGSAWFRGRVWLAEASAPQDEFRLLTAHAAGQLVISFPALGPDSQGRNRYYTLEQTTNPVDGMWVAVPGYSNLLGAGQTISYATPPTGTLPRFFRGWVDMRSP